MLTLQELITLGNACSEIKELLEGSRCPMCCYCKHIRTKLEPVFPGESLIIHYCDYSGDEVGYNQGCKNGKFEKKND